ncbi:TetR/AcrR family transcriptional regulator [Paenibacillus flagellatus]|uniref:TetR family transcriptional regulator n=1 Tax=Paenibacillus flagellatus TaxID=2211139 RepID=A0A2V5KIU5_9BACL|nr:TetR/AcrR family transcriptional regulator [Paenibacillus flagellatus]PYI54460.1 TetR family transcriptional regulator [Paenibacillus flagellatus]
MSEPVEQWVKELLQSYDEEGKMTEKQLRILNAAIEVFAEKGFAASSTSEIAQRAAVAEGTIFRHYKTKKELLLSIVAPMMSKLIAPFVLRDFSKVLDAKYARYEDFMRAVLINRAEFARNHLPVIKIMLQEIPFHPELKEQFVERVGKKVLERIVPVIRKFQDEGQIVPIPPESVLRLSASAILGFLLMRFVMLPEREWDDAKEIDTTLDFILYGLSASGRPPVA